MVNWNQYMIEVTGHPGPYDYDPPVFRKAEHIEKLSRKHCVRLYDSWGKNASLRNRAWLTVAPIGYSEAAIAASNCPSDMICYLDDRTTHVRDGWQVVVITGRAITGDNHLRRIEPDA